MVIDTQSRFDRTEIGRVAIRCNFHFLSVHSILLNQKSGDEIMRKRSDIVGKVDTTFQVVLEFEIVTSERKGGGFSFVVNDMLVDSGLG